MRLRRVAIVLPLVLVALRVRRRAAAMTTDRAPTRRTQDPAALEGESWILTQMLTAGGQTEVVQTGVSAQFDGTTISGTAGCNSYNASYEAERERDLVRSDRRHEEDLSRG